MIKILDGVAFFPDIQAVLVSDDSSAILREDYDMQAVAIGKYKIAPWGEDNLLPNHILAKIEKNDVVSSNINFNRNVCYGLGPKIVKVLNRNADGSPRAWEEVTSGPEYDFFQKNDIPMFVLQQLTDMLYYHNAFPEFSYGKDGKISTIRHREAIFSRWSMMNAKGQLNTHYYCSDWSKATKNDIIATRVLDEFDPITELTMYRARKERMIFPVYMPSPGRPYYSRPEWYSIFRSGWYDHSCMVPKLKKAILQNQLGVKYIIYISPKYFEDIFRKEGIDKNDRKATKERIDQEVKNFEKFLAGEKNANKTILALKDLIPTANGTTEHKWIEITPIANDLKGGEYIDDTESTANIICYAMGVHSALIGATPGKNSSTISGSNARELYMMKQALMRPFVDRVMRSLKVIKEFNKWDKDILITIPEYIFTTLDQNKQGKQESTQQNV